MKIHRIVYGDDTSQIREVSEPNTSRLWKEHFPTQNAKSLNETKKSPPNIFNKREELKEERKRDFAEATPPKKASRWTAETASKYLADVETASTDALTRSALHCECKSLSEIVEDQSLPEKIRNRAATLRTMAREAAHNRLDRCSYADLSAEGAKQI
jgi:hypothetical protein